MNERVYTVSAIVKYVKGMLDQNPYLSSMLVQGEISNLTRHRSGHWYFTLKDERARLSCVMFASYASKCRVNVRDGMKVIVRGSLSMYEAQGSVQCYVSSIRSDGLGDLYMQYEELRKKLHAEGWFDEAHKKPVPRYACDIAVVTAKEGAAIHDVLSTIARRWPLADVTLYPAYVQGANAAPSLIDALQRADRDGHECILLVRGGGSIEDLWGFNSEALVHCIYALNTPVISGVGHESDTTLVDFVSDLRAPTPTGAASMVTCDIRDVKMNLYQSARYLQERLQTMLSQARRQLDVAKENRYLKDPLTYAAEWQMHLAWAGTQLKQAKWKILNTREGLAHRQQMMLQLMKQRQVSAQKTLAQQQEMLDERIMALGRQRRQQLADRAALLDAYSPLAVLRRGYTMTVKDGHVVRSAAELHARDRIRVRFGDGVKDAVIAEEDDDAKEGII